MLQTMPIKPDAAAQTVAKDRSTAADNRPDSANTFYSQFLAAMPEARGSGLKADPALTLVRDPKAGTPFRDQLPSARMKPQASGTPPSDRSADPRLAQPNGAAPPPRPASAKAPDPAAPPRPVQAQDGAGPDGPDGPDDPDGLSAATRAKLARAAKLPDPSSLAAAGAELPTPTPDAPDAEGQQAQPQAQAGQAAPTDAEAAAEAASAAGAAATAAWLATPGLQGQDSPTPGLANAGPGAPNGPQPPAGTAPEATPGHPAGAVAGQPSPQAPPARATAPETVAAAKAQAALDQLVPGGGKVQFQFGDSPTQTTKPALSEFMNQLKPQLQAPSFAGVGSASGDPQAPTAATGPQADLQALAPAAPASVLTAGQLPKETAPEPLKAPGNISPAETLAVGAAPGAGGSARITAPKAVEPAPPRQENPMTQVDSTIKWLIKNKEQSAELQLHPENLGRVQIKLTIEGHEVHAKLWASEAAALPVLQDHRAFLEDSLKGQGLHLGSFDLQHGQQGDQAALPRPEPSLPPPLLRPGPEPGQETPAQLSQGAAGPGRISIVA